MVLLMYPNEIKYAYRRAQKVSSFLYDHLSSKKKNVDYFYSGIYKNKPYFLLYKEKKKRSVEFLKTYYLYLEA